MQRPFFDTTNDLLTAFSIVSKYTKVKFQHSFLESKMSTRGPNPEGSYNVSVITGCRIMGRKEIGLISRQFQQYEKYIDEFISKWRIQQTLFGTCQFMLMHQSCFLFCQLTQKEVFHNKLHSINICHLTTTLPTFFGKTCYSVKSRFASLTSQSFFPLTITFACFRHKGSTSKIVQLKR